MQISTTFIVGILTIGALAINARAEDKKFDKKHPRRAEVIHREQNEKRKNNAAAAQGKITQQQANKLDAQDNKIRQQERTDAAENGGHITKAEQHQLNKEENHVNQERNNMEKRDAAAGGTPPAPPTNN